MITPFLISNIYPSLFLLLLTFSILTIPAAALNSDDDCEFIAGAVVPSPDYVRAAEPCGEQMYELELGVATDASFCRSTKYSWQDVEVALKLATEQLEAVCVKLSVVAIDRCEQHKNRYAALNGQSASAILASFRDVWPSHLRLVDAAILFTAFEDGSPTAGRAYYAGTCGPYRFAWVEHPLVGLVGHEIGHLLGANHVAEGLMRATTDLNRAKKKDMFSNASRAEIAGFLQAPDAFCLTRRNFFHLNPSPSNAPSTTPTASERARPSPSPSTSVTATPSTSATPSKTATPSAKESTKASMSASASASASPSVVASASPPASVSGSPTSSASPTGPRTREPETTTPSTGGEPMKTWRSDKGLQCERVGQPRESKDSTDKFFMLSLLSGEKREGLKQRDICGKNFALACDDNVKVHASPLDERGRIILFTKIRQEWGVFNVLFSAYNAEIVQYGVILSASKRKIGPTEMGMVNVNRTNQKRLSCAEGFVRESDVLKGNLINGKEKRLRAYVKVRLRLYGDKGDTYDNLVVDVFDHLTWMPSCLPTDMCGRNDRGTLKRMTLKKESEVECPYCEKTLT